MNCLQTVCNTHVKRGCTISLSGKTRFSATTVVQKLYLIDSLPQQITNTHIVIFFYVCTVHF